MFLPEKSRGWTVPSPVARRLSVPDVERVRREPFPRAQLPSKDEGNIADDEGPAEQRARFAIAQRARALQEALRARGVAGNAGADGVRISQLGACGRVVEVARAGQELDGARRVGGGPPAAEIHAADRAARNHVSAATVLLAPRKPLSFLLGGRLRIDRHRHVDGIPAREDLVLAARGSRSFTRAV